MISLQPELPAKDQFGFFDTGLEMSSHLDDALFDPHCEGHHEASFSYMRKSYSNMHEEAIDRYHRDMLEVARDLPEYAYELSMRDLMELPKIVSSMQKARGSGRDSFSGFWSGEEKTKTKKGNKRRSRSESMDFGGFFLRMFFPLPQSGKKKSLRISGSCSMISLKSVSINGEEYGLQKSGNVGKENELRNPSKSSSTKSSISSNNSNRKTSGCYPFFHTSKNKNKKPSKDEEDLLK